MASIQIALPPNVYVQQNIFPITSRKHLCSKIAIATLMKGVSQKSGMYGYFGTKGGTCAPQVAKTSTAIFWQWLVRL